MNDNLIRQGDTVQTVVTTEVAKLVYSEAKKRIYQSGRTTSWFIRGLMGRLAYGSDKEVEALIDEMIKGVSDGAMAILKDRGAEGFEFVPTAEMQEKIKNGQAIVIDPTTGKRVIVSD